MINSLDNKISNNNVSFTAKIIPDKSMNRIIKSVTEAKSIDIYCHSSPDEDTVNSMKVWYALLKKLGKNVSICVNTKEAKGLFFNPASYKVKKSLKTPDLALVLDFNGTERLPKSFISAFSKNNPKNVIGLDHHHKSDTFINAPGLYVDNSARSCCGIVYRFFEKLKLKLDKRDLESLYCGMLSDFQKSKLINFEKTSDGLKIVKKPALLEDKNSLDILNKIEKQLGSKSKAKVYKHLDILSSLTPAEKAFQKRIFSEIKLSKNGELAYLKIDPKDKDWMKLGYDNNRSSTIIGNLRTRILNLADDDNLIPESLKSKLKSVKGVIAFYKVSDKNNIYQMSIHSKGDYAGRLINHIKTNIDPAYMAKGKPNLVAGGHADRAGGRVVARDGHVEEDINDFVEKFMIGSETLK